MSTSKTRSEPSSHGEAAFSFVSPTGSWTLWGPFSAYPARQALAALDQLETACAAWRSFVDVSRSAIREQQDTALRAWGAPLANAAGMEDDAGPGAAHTLTWPMTVAMESYERLTGAMLQTQRDAVKAFSGPAKLN
jgi:hypothetical protein